jgi:hypothetical protein
VSVNVCVCLSYCEQVSVCGSVCELMSVCECEVLNVSV